MCRFSLRVLAEFAAQRLLLEIHPPNYFKTASAFLLQDSLCFPKCWLNLLFATVVKPAKTCYLISGIANSSEQCTAHTHRHLSVLLRNESDCELDKSRV